MTRKNVTDLEQAQQPEQLPLHKREDECGEPGLDEPRAAPAGKKSPWRRNKKRTACCVCCCLLCGVPVLTFLISLICLVMGSGFSATSEFGTWPYVDDDGYYKAHKEGSRWINYWGKDRRPGAISFLIGAAFKDKDYSNIPKKDELDKTLPVHEPYWMRNENFSVIGRPGIRATWLGHATVLAEIDGTIVITDPIFSERASPVQWSGPKRYRPPACTVDQLPEGLSAVVISHSHYDHLDYNTCQQLQDRYGNKLHWFVPDGIGSWLKDYLQVENVHDMVWWQTEELPGTSTKFVLTPANHWGRRGLFDENKQLWGSWAVLGPTKKFWFGGDTGYCDAFKQIGRKLGPFDLSAIPIGAYNPRWFMRWHHVNPEEAVSIHQDIMSRKSVGIHWATFKLTYEHYLEPREKIPQILNERSLEQEQFMVVDIGKTVEG